MNRRKMKRKSREICTSPILDDSPKRTKVHAQRKFAQGSNVNSPVMTPIKELESERPINVLPEPVELLPIKRPNTEDFLTFLCFRGTPILPQNLNFFNTASIVDTNGQVHKIKSESPKNGPIDAPISKCGSSSEKPFIAFGVRKRADPIVISKQMDRKRRHALAIQALRRKYQEQKMAKIRALTISKLSEKVTNKTLVRTNSISRTETVTKKTNAVQKSQQNVKVIATKHVKVTTRTLKTTIRPNIKQKMCLRSYRGRFVQKELPFKKKVGLDKPDKPNKKADKNKSPNKEEEESNFETEEELESSPEVVKKPIKRSLICKTIQKTIISTPQKLQSGSRMTRSGHVFNNKVNARIQQIKKRILLNNPTTNTTVKRRALRSTTMKKTVISRKSQVLRTKKHIRRRSREDKEVMQTNKEIRISPVPTKIDPNKKHVISKKENKTPIKKESIPEGNETKKAKLKLKSTQTIQKKDPTPKIVDKKDEDNKNNKSDKNTPGKKRNVDAKNDKGKKSAIPKEPVQKNIIKIKKEDTIKESEKSKITEKSDKEINKVNIEVKKDKDSVKATNPQDTQDKKLVEIKVETEVTEKPVNNTKPNKYIDNINNSKENIVQLTENTKPKDNMNKSKDNINKPKESKTIQEIKSKDKEVVVKQEPKQDIPKRKSGKAEEFPETKSSKTEDLSVQKTTRPTRKTKEAATIYMEILSHKLGNDSRIDDDNVSIDSFPELPNVKKMEQRENELKAKAKSKEDDKEEDKSPEKIKNNSVKKLVKKVEEAAKPETVSDEDQDKKIMISKIVKDEMQAVMGDLKKNLKVAKSKEKPIEIKPSPSKSIQKKTSLGKRKSNTDIIIDNKLSSDDEVLSNKIRKTEEIKKKTKEVEHSDKPEENEKRQTRNSQPNKSQISDDSDESFHADVKVSRKKKLTRSKVPKVASTSFEEKDVSGESDQSTTSDVDLNTLKNRQKNKKFTKTKSMKKSDGNFSDSDEEPLSKLTHKSVDGSQCSILTKKSKTKVETKSDNKPKEVKRVSKKAVDKVVVEEVPKVKPKRECAKIPQNYLPMFSSSSDEEYFHGFSQKPEEETCDKVLPKILEKTYAHLPPSSDLLSKDISRRFGKEKVNMSNEQIEKWLKDSAMAGSSSIKKENDEMLKFGEIIPTETTLELQENIDTHKLKSSLLPDKNEVKPESKVCEATSSCVTTPEKVLKPDTPSKIPLDRKLIFRKDKKESAPNINAFSPENESSVYAFGEDTEPILSTPFRRPSRRPSSTATSRSEDESGKLDELIKSGVFITAFKNPNIEELKLQTPKSSRKYLRSRRLVKSSEIVKKFKKLI
ncbi:unnamed protein product [Brassicogethes aeneus]|uniref:Uncharacterized protein n=1 Tax=Brassicogethes aeneus TaxID=1431903 RepID=A0A9P0AT02_BRAAE|nr:unnamed protein product [Brassicogethes aeneus]